jgi:hypothetical protein
MLDHEIFLKVDESLRDLGPFGIVFEGRKNAFNTQKVRLNIKVFI